jgi:mycothiol synthase
VRGFIDPNDNLKYQRLRGWTEFISVGRPWRRRGLARALISLSLKAQKARGMTHSALGVDGTNTSGANRVYEDCGFKVVGTRSTYQKAK